MRKRLLIGLGVILVLGATALLVLRSHAVEIIHAVVQNAVIQKAPSGYPIDRIREAFSTSLQAAQREGKTDDYLEQLKAISLRIEKVQRLEKEKVDELLEQLKRP